MKIAFLCGSLEPWRDGVGDYTRRLAGDLQACGHQVLVTRHDSQLRGQRTPEPDSHPLLMRYVDALPDVVLQPDDLRRTPGLGTPISSTLLADLAAATQRR